MGQRDITNEVGLFLESLYEVRGHPWTADGETVPTDYVGMPDGLMPAVIRQSYAVACTLNREDTFRDAVIIEPDSNALLGVSVRILQTDPVSDALRLQIMHMAFSALERHDPLKIWENPIDPIQMIVEAGEGQGRTFHEILRGLRSAELFDDLATDDLSLRPVDSQDATPFAEPQQGTETAPAAGPADGATDTMVMH
jgi:hypothetical protein